MTSNAGNDTAAAFQVGDRVHVVLPGDQDYGAGIVAYGPLFSGWLYVKTDNYGLLHLPVSRLTLISRATPAPARNSFAMTMPCQFGKHGECDGILRVGNLATSDVVSSPCECECHPTGQPATPAPAATPPALDTLQRALNAMDHAIHEALRTESIRESTVGEALEAIRQAVHALAKDHQGHA